MSALTVPLSLQPGIKRYILFMYHLSADTADIIRNGGGPMNIDIDTRFICLLGRPLAQSFSSTLQNSAYSRAGLNMVYFYSEVDNEHLGDVVTGLRYMPFAGFAVTKPCKVEVMKYLDGYDPLCEKMGASNTVVRTADGRLIGYNTDGAGFYRSFTEESGLDAAETTFFCFGAGGAARAMCCALAYHGAKKIYITSESGVSAEKLADEINRGFSPCAEAVAPGGYRDVIARCGVVMNATGVGMGESVGRSPMDRRFIVPGTLYYDACYNPGKTRFLADAEKAGCRTLNGVGMLLYQAIAQIELWTGKKVPAEEMRRDLMRIISER